MIEKKIKIIRVTTVSNSLRRLLKGQLKFMNQTFDIIGVSSQGEALSEVVENEGIRVVALRLSRSLSPLKDIVSLWRMFKLFRKEKPVIVHTHTPKAGTIGMMAAKLAGVPYRLHTIAGLPLLEVAGPKRKLLNFVEKITYACATKIYPNSHGLKEIILEQKFTTLDKLKVIGNGSSNGIDTSFFNTDKIADNSIVTLEDSLKIVNDSFVYIYVGRMVRDKGIYELIESFLEIYKTNANAILLLVGKLENDYEPLTEKIIKSIENHPAICTVGYQPDVRPYFAVADVLVFPSYREGFPNVVLQAGAMKLNSIVTNINGCNEIIKDGYNGFIVPVKNSKELQNKMKYLIENSNVNDEMSDKARGVICEKYEQEFVWNELLKEYKILIE